MSARRLDRSSVWRRQKPAAVRVLAADPGLGSGLEPAEAALAREHLLTPVRTLRPGPWWPWDEATPDPGELGLLILEGFLLRRVRVGNRESVELLGAGDLLRPADYHEDRLGPIRFECTWRVLQRARVAVLDPGFAVAAARWPAVLSALMSRTLRRSRHLALLMAIGQLQGVDLRLQAVLWHLADRFGHVGPDGVVVPVRLTHDVLGRLVGAQRPSVSTALKRLIEAGVLVRRTDRSWLIVGDPPAQVSGLVSVAGTA